MKNPESVVCNWTFNSKKRQWDLYSIHLIDDSGYIVKATQADINNRKYNPEHWLYDENIPIIGRVVTLWGMNGVRLLGIHPPEWTNWISPSFYDEIIKLPNWYMFIADGSTLFVETINHAKKHLTFIGD